MARKKVTQREFYSDIVRQNIFRHVSPAWIQKTLGISYQTARSWEIDGGKMPAWRYFQIRREIENHGVSEVIRRIRGRA